MKSRAGSAVVRLGLSCWLLALLLQASCGTSYDDATRSGQGLGGSLRPNEDAYRLTPTQDAIVPATGRFELPSSVDLAREGAVPPVRNQRWNNCVAWSVGYYLMSSVWARFLLDTGESDPLDLTDPENWFSPDYIYAQRDTRSERQERAPDEPSCSESDGELGCMRPEQALKILVTQGCSKWTAFCDSPGLRSCDPEAPIDLTLPSRPFISARVREGALQFRPRCYVRFGALGTLGQDTIRRMQAWLHEQRTPIAVVVDMTSGWVTYRGENRAQVVIEEGEPPVERSVCLDAAGANLGGQHMMTVVGYDDEHPSRANYPGLAPDAYRGSFRIINQWGTKWGDRGYMWVPYSELAKIWVAGYGILERDEAQPEEPEGVVCEQDPVTGQWLNIFEEDDVPENFAINPATGELEFQRTAQRLDIDQSCSSTVGGDDLADWYVVEVTQSDLDANAPTGPVMDVKLELTNTGGPLDVRITDDRFQRLTWNNFGLDDGRLCDPGCYFVKISLPPGTPSTTIVEYTFKLCPQACHVPNWLDGICVAQEIELSESITGELSIDCLFDNQDRFSCWPWYKLPAAQAAREVVAILDAPDVGLAVFRGRTPSAAYFVGWTTRSPPSGDVAQAIIRLRPAAPGESLWFHVLPHPDIGPFPYAFQVVDGATNATPETERGGDLPDR